MIIGVIGAEIPAKGLLVNMLSSLRGFQSRSSAGPAVCILDSTTQVAFTTPRLCQQLDPSLQFGARVVQSPMKAR
jgi:hypothetical protein